MTGLGGREPSSTNKGGIHAFPCCFMMTDLHQEAARIICKFNLKEGFIKNLVYSSTYTNLRQLFALVSETIRYQTILTDLLERLGPSLLSEELVKNDTELAIVLLYEQLLGAGFGRAGFVRKMMRKYKGDITAARDAILKENNAESLADVSKNLEEKKDFPTLPRYARVNLIKSTVQGAIDSLCVDGWEYVGKLQADRFQEAVSSLSEYQFGGDPLLKDVLVFPKYTDLHNDRHVVNGSLVLQERASCVPAHVLNPPPGSVVLDCCAAPGNKTSHIASLMGNQGQVTALDRDAKRLSTMNTLLAKTGTTCVETVVQDFLTLSPDSPEVSDITMILLDPSCSCTGMPTGTSYRQEVPMDRLHSLKRSQISLLKHALRFPNVQRVVYSTCSTSRQENEEVVEEVMGHVRRSFTFVPVFPDWPNSRGFKRFVHHTSFLRLSPEEHLSAGFFVACFQRISKPDNSCEDSSRTGEEMMDASVSDSLNRNGDHEFTMTCDKENECNGEQRSPGSSKKEKRKRRADTENDSECEETSIKVKKKKRKQKESENDSLSEEIDVKVKKKKKSRKETENDSLSEETDAKEKKKKKRRKENENDNLSEETDAKEKKKKKRRKENENDNLSEETDAKEKKKKKSRKETENDSLSEETNAKEKKKKKRRKENENDNLSEEIDAKEKKKKKSRKETENDSLSEETDAKEKKKKKRRKENDNDSLCEEADVEVKKRKKKEKRE